MVEFRRAHKSRVTLSIAPLVDIVFLLLIFFLLSSSFQNPAINLTLPETENDAYQEKRPITVTLDEQRRLFLNLEEVDLEEFPARLRRLMEKENSFEVIFRGDRTLAYEQVLQIMGLAKQAGAQSIDLVHRREP